MENYHSHPNNVLDNPENHRIIQAITILQKLATSWDKRAQVRRFSFCDNINIKTDTEDFLVDLLPFKDHSFFLEASDTIKSKILSCGWLLYNKKTLAIETEIIQPTLKMILDKAFPGVANNIIQQVTHETMIDEYFHVLLVNQSIALTSKHRNINLKFPTFNLIKNMKSLQSKYNVLWQKQLIQLATAVVSEIFISDYLKLLSDNEDIQPINRLSVSAHREDELAHNNIFKNIMQCIYTNLNKKQQKFLSEILLQPAQWFADAELNVWKSILLQINFIESTPMINDCYSIDPHGFHHLNYADLLSFADLIGITLMQS